MQFKFYIHALVVIITKMQSRKHQHEKDVIINVRNLLKEAQCLFVPLLWILRYITLDIDFVFAFFIRSVCKEIGEHFFLSLFFSYSFLLSSFRLSIIFALRRSVHSHFQCLFIFIFYSPCLTCAVCLSP